MTNQEKRPVHLNLFTIHLPITGLVSILHRISGFALFLTFLVLVWLLDRSLLSEESFSHLVNELKNLIILKITLLLISIGFIFHMLAGIKKMLSEFFGIGEALQSYKIFSIWTFIFFFIACIFLLVLVF